MVGWCKATVTYIILATNVDVMDTTKLVVTGCPVFLMFHVC